MAPIPFTSYSPLADQPLPTEVDSASPQTHRLPKAQVKTHHVYSTHSQPIVILQHSEHLAPHADIYTTAVCSHCDAVWIVRVESRRVTDGLQNLAEAIVSKLASLIRTKAYKQAKKLWESI